MTRTPGHRFVTRTANQARSLVLAGAMSLAGLAAANGAFAADAGAVNAIIKSLAPVAGQTVSSGYRQRKPDDVKVGTRKVRVDLAYSIDLEVYFAFDSSKLTRRAMEDLDALGAALESPELRPFSYLIAGHTDAKGKASYNQRLSEQRALAVVRFLIRDYAIDPGRLIAVGFGEERLKVPSRPRAAINRRVEVTLIVPAAAGGGVTVVTPPGDGGTTIVVPPGSTVTIEKGGDGGAQGDTQAQGDGQAQGTPSAADEANSLLKGN